METNVFCFDSLFFSDLRMIITESVIHIIN